MDAWIQIFGANHESPIVGGSLGQSQITEHGLFTLHVKHLLNVEEVTNSSDLAPFKKKKKGLEQN